MAKKEFKVGETFQCGLVKLKVVQAVKIVEMIVQDVFS